ncbi:MAG: methyltransferase domain-containing protein [Cellvibrionaceae bacterium]
MSKKQCFAGFFGVFLIPFFPERVSRLQNTNFTLAENTDSYKFIDKLLRLGLIYKVIKEGNTHSLTSYHFQFWKSEEAANYHRKEQDSAPIVPQFSYMIDELKALVDQQENEIDMVCEIGSGSGLLIHHLSEEISNVERFIGLDLSEETISDCNKKYENKKLSYIATDASEWLKSQEDKNWVLVSHRGVLEYFNKEILLDLFKHIKTQNAKSIFIIIEPVGIEHDLTNDKNSQPYSNEFSFSHNYEHLFSTAGYKVIHSKIEPYKANVRLHGLIAETD